MDELEQMHHELGFGPTTEPDHNPYPNVHVEPRQPAAPQPSPGCSSHGNPRGQQMPRDIGIEAELGVDTSFDRPQARLKASALAARPMARPSGASTLTRSQPTSNSCHRDDCEEEAPRPRPTSQGTAPSLPHVSGSATRPRRPTQAGNQPKTLAARLPPLSQARARLAIPQPPRALLQPEANNLPYDPVHFELVTHAVSDHVRDPIPGTKPRRGEWEGVIRQLTAEERELIILQAWGRANVYLKQTRPHQNITRQQVQYIQNIFPACRKLIKTRLEGLVSSEFHLHDGTDNEIHERVERQLLPHGFHSRIADIIEEHSSGAHVTKPTRVETLRPLFNTYLGSLSNLQEVNLPRLQNLLMRLHDDCIARSGVFKDPVAEQPNNVIPAEQFDPAPVEPYQPWYDIEQLAALATRVHLIDDEDLDM
ncbi:hypothetical protein FRC06_010913, partial [Ceratobasidium sp. 370]